MCVAKPSAASSSERSESASSAYCIARHHAPRPAIAVEPEGPVQQQASPPPSHHLSLCGGTEAGIWNYDATSGIASTGRPSTASGVKIRTPIPNPQSQSFSRSYGSILPTSLIYIVLSTRGCSPWRPDAVMSTTRSANKSLRRIFKGRRERTGHLKD